MSYRKHSGTAGESAEIANVRKMSDEESVQAMLFKLRLQFAPTGPWKACTKSIACRICIIAAAMAVRLHLKDNPPA